LAFVKFRSPAAGGTHSGYATLHNHVAFGTEWSSPTARATWPSGERAFGVQRHNYHRERAFKCRLVLSEHSPAVAPKSINSPFTIGSKDENGHGQGVRGVGSTLNSKTIHGSRELSIRRKDKTSLCRHLTF